ncbi:MAG: cation:proton antiporter [SAR202 cluster bacterium]|nr:MAG: cation:proton antiporter [SAR202 cluster bacterium]MBH39340.1 sodium:proton exchanger [Chloroflexota bacterium]MCH2527274.1 cation:proton antiporter [Dehalococcoidia bacterium]MEC9308601.1 cation:proton antiporter [Chloroflexota bacterium]
MFNFPLLSLPFFSSPMGSYQFAGGELTEIVIHILIQLAVILFVAKLSGELASRFLKIPPVLAELAAGVMIGPFALGGIAIPGFGPLFPIPMIDGHAAAIPVSTELFVIAQVGSIFLLFAIGLETNLKQFLRYAGPATAVAIGGVVIPFFLGAWATVAFGFAGPAGIWSPSALFIGAIMTATSVGITARVLSDLSRLDSPEGVTVLAAAVVDDVLGILVLTVVVGLSVAGSITATGIGLIAFKAIAFWLGLTVVGILVAPYIERIVNRFKVSGAGLVLTVALALFAAGLAEIFGLAFIIGAFSIGLALSTTKMGHTVEEQMIPVTNILVPVFFVVMGMLVDVSSMMSAIWFGLVISLLAILSKVFGSGIPALFTGFNLRGASRIGVGMMPRGEVALIIAGIGLTNGIIGQELFGVSIMMTVITTLLAPIVLIPLFKRGGEGTRKPGSDNKS